MEKTVLNVKINKDLKDSAREVAKELGLPLSVIVNSYLRKFVDERRIEFNAPLIPNKKTQKLLDEISKDIDEGKNLCGPFETIEEMDKFLNSY